MQEEKQRKVLTANKGEWAEFYAFLKVLCENKLPSADENLRVHSGRYFEFISVDWNDPSCGAIEYTFDANNIYIVRHSDNLKKTIPKTHITQHLVSVFKAITEGKKTFSIPAAEQVMHDLLRTSLKAPSADKSDIFGKLVDRSTNTAEQSGFSVKSLLKNKATLLNHSGQTLFRYELSGITPALAHQISTISKTVSDKIYVHRTQEILRLGGTFDFVKMSSKTFEKTLRRIDTMLPEIVAEMLVGFFAQDGRKLSELTDYLATSNNVLKKFNFQLEAEDYKFKLKQLLVASALGMQPSKVWDGMMKANGGYLVVMPSGTVLCYHAFNRDIFLNYLFNNTAFESPGARGRPYLTMIHENGKVFTDLKLQIRFTK